MRVHVIRTAMIGGGLSYDVYVPVSQCLECVRENGKYRHLVTHIGRDSLLNGKHSYYLDFPEATAPESYFAMPQGWDKYEEWKRHSLGARTEMLAIARTVFPELERYQGDTIPQLWVCGLLAEETSAEFIVHV